MKTMLLPVRLTEEEVLARGREMARVKDEHTKCQDGLERTNEAWKEDKRALETRLEVLEFDLRHLASAIRTGVEDREVEVREEPNYAQGVMRTIRLDTGDLVLSRGLDEHERQQALFTEIRENMDESPEAPEEAVEEAG